MGDGVLVYWITGLRRSIDAFVSSIRRWMEAEGLRTAEEGCDLSCMICSCWIVHLLDLALFACMFFYKGVWSRDWCEVRLWTSARD